MHPNRVYIVGSGGPGTGATAEASKRVIAFTIEYLGFLSFLSLDLSAPWALGRS